MPEAPSSLPPSRSLPRHPRRGRARPGGRGPPPSLARRPPAQRQAPPAAAAATRELPHRRGHVCSGGTNNTQTCCAGFPGPYRPAVPPAPPQRRRGRGAPQPAARYPVSPPAACRGEAAPAREAGRGRAALPQGRATAAPREGRQPAAAPTPPPGEQSAAEPQGLCRARGRRADPSAGLGRGKSPSGRGYSPGCGAAGARGWEEAGGRAGGRGAEPGPARSGRAVAAAAAALSRLVPPRWPGGGSPGTGGRLRPLPRRQGDGEHRTLPRPPPLRRPRFSNPPPARGARSRDTARPCRGAAAAAARDPARPSDGGAKPHPAGRQCAAAAPLGGCRALRPAGLGPRPRPGLLSGAGGPLRVPRGARGGCGAPGAGGPGEVAVVAPRSLEVHVRECGPNASHLDHRRKPVAQRGPQADIGSHPRPFAIRVSVLAAPARVLFPPIGCPGSWTNILKPLSRQD